MHRCPSGEGCGCRPHVRRFESDPVLDVDVVKWDHGSLPSSSRRIVTGRPHAVGSLGVAPERIPAHASDQRLTVLTPARRSSPAGVPNRRPPPRGRSPRTDGLRRRPEERPSSLRMKLMWTSSCLPSRLQRVRGPSSAPFWGRLTEGHRPLKPRTWVRFLLPEPRRRLWAGGRLCTATSGVRFLVSAPCSVVSGDQPRLLSSARLAQLQDAAPRSRSSGDERPVEAR